MQTANCISLLSGRVYKAFTFDHQELVESKFSKMRFYWDKESKGLEQFRKLNYSKPFRTVFTDRNNDVVYSE